jgi:anti-anti-sigma factor
MSLSHSLSRTAGACTIQLSGQFTFSENGTFRTLLDEVLRDQPRKVVVDLSGLTTMDSAALSMLVLLRDRISKIGGTVTLSRPPTQIARILEVVDFGKLFTITA